MRISFSMLVLISLFAMPHSAVAKNRSPVRQVSVTTRGLRLSLKVPEGAYPRNALLLTEVTLRNVSRHAVYFAEEGPTANGFGTPQAEVVDNRGIVLYPPALSAMLSPRPGQTNSVAELAAGQSYTWHEYVILRASRLRAWVDEAASSSLTAPTLRMTTPTLRMQLTAGTPLRVNLQVNGGLVSAIVHRPTDATGELVYIDTAQCAYPSYETQPGQPVGTQYPEHFFWTTTPKHRLTPEDLPSLGPCPDTVQWHVLAGWVGLPVAQIDFPSW